MPPSPPQAHSAPPAPPADLRCPCCDTTGTPDALRVRLVAALHPLEVFTAVDGQEALRCRTADELADAALDALGIPAYPYVDEG